MIIYGSLADVSIGSLFIAGIIPGLLLLLAFMCYVIFWSLKSSWIAPSRSEKYTWKEKILALPDIVPSGCLIFAVIGGIYFGVVTPTEAAGVGAFGAIIISALTGKFGFRMLGKSLRDSILATSMMMMIVAGAAILAWGFNLLRVPQTITQKIIEMGWNPYATLGLIALSYFVMGCFIDGISICIITIPIIYPMMMALGFDPLWFGVFLTINIELSLLTPPLGMNLYVLKGANPDLKMIDIMIGAAPFCVILVLALVGLILFPQLAIWLPHHMMR
jgi:tripartite ATP-independent transporter DctM subunit